MGRNGESPAGGPGSSEKRQAMDAQTMPQDSPEVKGRRINVFGRFRGAFIPNAILQHPGLTPSAKLMWGRLAQFAGRDGSCYPSLPRLATELALSKRQVMRVIAELERGGFIEVERPEGTAKKSNRHASNSYWFIEHPCLSEPEAVTSMSPLEPVSSDIHVAEAVTCVSPEAVTSMSPKDTILRSSGNTTHTNAVCVSSASLPKEQEEYISLLSKREYTEGRVRNLGAFRAKLREKARLGELDTVELKALRKWNEEHEAAKQAARFEAIENAAYGVWYDAPGPDRAKAFLAGAMDEALAQHGPEIREALERLFASEIAEARNPRSEPASTPPKYEPEAAPW